MEEGIETSILWEAKTTFNNILDYLRKEWTEKEEQAFVNRTNEILDRIKRYPEMSRPSLKQRGVRIHT